MNKINKILILMQILLLNLVCQDLTKCAAIIQSEQKTTDLDLKLIIAAKDGNKEKVKQLIEHGANVNGADKNGSTPLIWATARRYKETVELLLHAGANIENKNIYDVKAIDLARKYDYQDIVQMLEDESTRRVAIVKKFIENNQKWINANLGKEITESTSGRLIPNIANVIAQYAIEYNDLPLAVGLSPEENKEKTEQLNKKVTREKCVIS